MKRPLLIALASPCLIAPAFADAPAANERLDTVFVTTPGPDRAADELVGSATSLDRESLVENLRSTLGDTLDSQPGVATSTFGQGASRPVLRGLGAERVQVLTNGIGVIDASAASPDHQVAADGIDAVKIEILRGPAALAYGGQAIGGVVNVIDGLIVEELPEKAVSGEAFGAFNSVNDGTELGGQAQFTTGPFVLSLSASMRDFDNYDIPDFAESALFRELEEAEEHGEDDHDEGEDHDHEEEEETRGTLENSFVETQTLAGGLSWIGDNAFLGVAVRHQTSEYGLPGHGEHGHGHDEEEHEGEEHDDEGEEEEEENPFIDLEHTRIDIRGGISVNNGFLTDIMATMSVVDYEHTEFEAPGEAGTVYESEGVEGRIEFDHEFAGFVGAFGLQYLDKDLAAFGEEAFISPTSTESLAAFIYETREWDSGFGIEGGLRGESVELDNANFGTMDFDLISGSLGLHQHLGNGLFVGGQLAYTERAPNESELFAFGPHLATEQFEVGDTTLSKESGLNLEGTARWRGENAGIGINVFATDFSDFIYLTPGQAVVEGMLVSEADELPVFTFVQQDASFVGGEIYADLTVDGILGAEWTFETSLDYVDAELDGGGNVPFVPPLTLNAGISAEWGAWEVGARLTSADNQNDPGAGELSTDGYQLIDLRAEVDLSDFGIGADGTEAFIEARNVTDEEVRFATSVLKDVAPAPGQNIRVGVRATF